MILYVELLKIELKGYSEKKCLYTWSFWNMKIVLETNNTHPTQCVYSTYWTDCKCDSKQPFLLDCYLQVHEVCCLACDNMIYFIEMILYQSQEFDFDSFYKNSHYSLYIADNCSKKNMKWVDMKLNRFHSLKTFSYSHFQLVLRNVILYWMRLYKIKITIFFYLKWNLDRYWVGSVKMIYGNKQTCPKKWCRLLD